MKTLGEIIIGLIECFIILCALYYLFTVDLIWVGLFSPFIIIICLYALYDKFFKSSHYITIDNIKLNPDLNRRFKTAREYYNSLDLKNIEEDQVIDKVIHHMNLYCPGATFEEKQIILKLLGIEESHLKL